MIPRQLFEVPIQAAVGKKIMARGNLSAIRKDVTAGLYGGHHERKLKHLENQKVNMFYFSDYDALLNLYVEKQEEDEVYRKHRSPTGSVF